MGDKTTLSDWIETLPSDGRYTFSREEAETATGASFVAVQTALRRLKQKGRIVSPRRGFYVFVPPEHRASGSPPASWYIDDLMRFCGREYYVSLLSAAALHGAGHQQPMVFQVIVDKTVPPIQVGRSRFKFYSSRQIGKSATVRVQTETGSMTVASPETTALDLVRFPEEVGYWSNIATVLAELADKLDVETLLSRAEQSRLPDIQRLGYVLSLLGHEHLSEALGNWLSERRTTVVRLRTDLPEGDAAVDARFRVIPNDEIESDL